MACFMCKVIVRDGRSVFAADLGNCIVGKGRQGAGLIYLIFPPAVL
jgi:hypothetical protein